MRPIASFLLLAGIAAACGPRNVPAPPEPAPVAASPSTRPVTLAPPPRRQDPQCRCVYICYVDRGGMLREIEVLYNPATGDTLTMDSLPVSSAIPLTREYASVAEWYVKDQPVTFGGRRYTRLGLSRVLAVSEVARVGEFRGVSVFADPTDLANAEHIIYLPTRPGCEFQAYQAVTPEPR